ncbi:MAG: carboxypeptidase-like regulatory domain-containing protein [Candidatus Acidiferrales bacterium]
MKISKSVLMAATLCLLFTLAGADAQNLERGAVHGTVYDTSHAVIAGANVKLTSDATGISRSLTTDDIDRNLN